VQARLEDLRRAFGSDFFGENAFVVIEGRTRSFAVVKRRIAGPAVAVADDEALALPPGTCGLLLLGFNDGRPFLVTLAAGELDAVLVDVEAWPNGTW